MSASTVLCPQCQSRVPADDINIAALLAKCSGCDHIFPLPLPDASRNALSSGGVDALPSAPPARPSGIKEDLGANGELFLRIRWFTPALLFLLFFCIAWDGFLIFWYAIALFGVGKMNGDLAGDGGFWLMVLFPICHVAVGVSLTYYVIAGFLNTTRILVDHDWLTLRHGPVPWWGNRDFPVADVREVETVENYSKKGQLTASLCLHSREGDQVVLISALPTQQADYLGYTIADHLHVPFRRAAPNSMVAMPKWFAERLERRRG